MTDPAPHPPYSEPCSKLVRVIFGGEVIAQSIDTRLVWEHPYYPQYYFPGDDVRVDLLFPSEHVSSHPELGPATHFTIRSGGVEAAGAAWQYPEAPVQELREHFQFDWPAMDHWYEEDEEVFVHPRNPYTRVDILESRRHVRIEIGGVALAESSRPKLLFETRLPVRYYLPQQDVRMDLLTPTGSHTQCPYKGIASYWSAAVDGVTYPDIVWSYPFPAAEAARVAGLMCFYDEKTDIIVDGERQQRPATKSS